MSDALTGEKVAQLQQEDIKFLLASDPLFSDVTVITEDEGDVLTQMDKALGITTVKEGKFGACAIVKQPVGSDEQAGNLQGPMMLEWEVLFLEWRAVNKDTARGGTGKKAWTLARRAHRIFKGHRSGGLTQTFTMKKPSVVPVASARELNGIPIPLVGYAVRFRGLEGDQTSYGKVALPTVSTSPGSITNEGGGTPTGAVGDTVTLSCATSGARLYYTFDMGHPCAENENATLYDAPFAAVEGTLRVRAHPAEGGTGAVLASDTLAVKFV